MTAALSRSPLFLAYRAATLLLEHGAKSFLRWRTKHGKEDPDRLRERLGHANRPRPEGALAWVHGASVGEGLALLPFIEQLAARGFHILLTTGTVTSSRVLATRIPDTIIHQFAPLDGPRIAQRFLGYWRPDLICFAESELWPNILGQAERQGIPLVLVNARMSQRSFARWKMMAGLIAPLLQAFDLILAQTDEDASRFTHLGARKVQQTGNLKFDVPPPPADPTELAGLSAALHRRPVWVAASTHMGEDEICCAVHRRVKAHLPCLLTIIVPRRADRGSGLADHAAALGLTASLRSRQQTIEPNTDIYIADTMGELGLFFRVANTVFVGKSLLENGGGQNPIEPAKLGNAIVHGPHVANFAAVYATFDRLQGGISVQGEVDLAETLSALLSDHARLEHVAGRAAQAVEECAGATARTMQAIESIYTAALERSAA